ncbi:hypothetical protein E1B28_000287 [Marasmius oreades]|uniref:Uncharacterized protein n=1 Tax=Marasmius oreades TaxID=181124 RepID=A0A9P7V147_9AGAR|nr:uncharacterized protein E1B28_000287 [Marasmius oreades]KAG7098326.1 hypothetical protein E1B28_000287 [Marasmius oreades]
MSLASNSLEPSHLIYQVVIHQNTYMSPLFPLNGSIICPAFTGHQTPDCFTGPLTVVDRRRLKKRTGRSMESHTWKQCQMSGQDGMTGEYEAAHEYLRLTKYDLDGQQYANDHGYPVLVTSDPHIQPKIKTPRSTITVRKGIQVDQKK